MRIRQGNRELVESDGIMSQRGALHGFLRARPAWRSQTSDARSNVSEGPQYRLAAVSFANHHLRYFYIDEYLTVVRGNFPNRKASLAKKSKGSKSLVQQRTHRSAPTQRACITLAGVILKPTWNEPD